MIVLLAAARADAAIAPCTATATGGAEASVAPGPVEECTLRLVDPTRRIRLTDGRSEPRTLLTYIRYPSDASGPFPLVIFAHGFDVTPAPYARLLDAWARAGYVVAAPVFPLTSPEARRDLDEADVVNEPTDMSFAITRLLAAGGPLSGLVDPARVAVAGQSDGGEAALAAAYSRRYADPRVRAAVVLSGAEMSGIGGYRFAPGSPALLAAQGTADTSNEPRYTYAYFRAARRPKYLLKLIGAGHLPPYTSEQPQLSIVAQVTTAFLDAYLKGDAASLQRLPALGDVPGTATLVTEP